MINLIPGDLTQWIPGFLFSMLPKVVKGKIRKRKEEKVPQIPKIMLFKVEILGMTTMTLYLPELS